MASHPLSGRQPFAASGPAISKDTATADGRFARAKAVAAFANKNAGLISAFHDKSPLGDLCKKVVAI